MSAIIQSNLFFNNKARPYKPFCTDDLSSGIKHRTFKQAITKRYIQVNPPHLRVWSIYDIDRAGGGLAWEDANLVEPAWATINKENGHAHIAFGLSVPVLNNDFGGVKALRYLSAIETAFADRMEADKGFSGLITKNPCSDYWKLLKGSDEAINGYDLDYLAEFIPNLEKYKPYSHIKAECYGLGRNCVLFEKGRYWAYRNVLNAKNNGCTASIWQNLTYNQLLQFNCDFPSPLLEQEVKHIAKSIAKWVWYRFDIAKSNQKFSNLQRYRIMQRHGNKKAELASKILMIGN